MRFFSIERILLSTKYTTKKGALDKFRSVGKNVEKLGSYLRAMTLKRGPAQPLIIADAFK
jgi:hypothetical protein